jgi:hypothetical protein
MSNIMFILEKIHKYQAMLEEYGVVAIYDGPQPVCRINHGYENANVIMAYAIDKFDFVWGDNERVSFDSVSDGPDTEAHQGGTQ